jgi:purine-nucleoside phosphorylase
MENRFNYEDARFAADEVRKLTLERSGVDISGKKIDGLILGSGLGDFAKTQIVDSVEIGFGEIIDKIVSPGERPRNMRKSDPGESVPGHAKKLVIGKLRDAKNNRLIVAQSGREHVYEGVSTRRATFWLRVMQLLGAETLIGSNASGILTPKNLKQGDLMLVHSDLDLADDSPLVGPNEEQFGPRFPHMGDLYPEATRKLAKEVAKEHNVQLAEGMYVRVKGPNYERKEDVYRLRREVEGIWREAQDGGHDERFTNGPAVAVVGMSSTYEQLAAQHATQSKRFPAFQKGRAYISVATNYAAGLSEKGPVAPPTHQEVQETADKVQKQFGKLVRELLIKMT